MDEKKANVQLFPAKVRVVPNCKLAKITANRTEEQFADLISGEKYFIVEKKKSKKRDEICSTYTITNADGYDGTDPLTFFDYSVLSVCDAEIAAGNTCTTPAIILRALTGKTKGTSGGTHNGAINKDQRDAIIASVTKMMSTVITIDVSAVNKELGYDGKKTITKQILPAYFETTTINGQVVEDTIYFYHDEKGNIIKSPIFEVAEQRNQIIRYDSLLFLTFPTKITPLLLSLLKITLCYALWKLSSIK